MKKQLIVCLTLGVLAAPAMATRALPQFRVNAAAEKSNATLTIERGALSAFGGSHEPNGILATTRDFKNTPLAAYVVFDDAVESDAIMDLSAVQGKIAGTVQCKRIRMGSSPDFPQVKTAVLAEACTIKALK